MKSALGMAAIEKIYIITFIYNIAFISNLDTRITVKVQECSTLDAAESSCPSLYPGSYLPFIWDGPEYAQVKQAMVSSGVNVTWLPLKRRHLGEFLWVNCKQASATFLALGWSKTSNCAYLALSDETLAAGFCYRRHGIICEMEDCRVCEDIHCLRINDRCFYKTCTGFTWDAARAYCRSRGWDLALPLDPWTETQLRLLISDHQPVCEYLWVGLRREEWGYPTTGTRNISHAFWGRAQPGLEGDCSVMEKTSSGEYVWRAVACSEKFQSLCVKNEMTTQSTRMSHRFTPVLANKPAVKVYGVDAVQRYWEKTSASLMIISGVCLAMLFIVILLLLLLLLCLILIKRRQMGQQINDNPEEMTSLN